MNESTEIAIGRAIGRAARSGADEGARAVARRFAERAAGEGKADVAYASVDTPLGPAALAVTSRGLVKVALPNEELDDVLDGLAADISPRLVEAPATLEPIRRELDEYFEGRRRDFDLRLDWQLVAPGFRRRVLSGIERVPYGVMITYGDAAEAAGSPRAQRAAGTALAHNPLPIVVPCHRVIRSGGVLGNYGGGPEMKRWLLRHEGAIDDPPQASGPPGLAGR